MIKKYKLAVLNAGPVRYQAPFFRKLAQLPEIDLTVYFCVNYQEYYDDSSLKGYSYKFLKNYSPFRKSYTQTNFGIIPELFKGKYDVILIYGYDRVTCWLAFIGAFLTNTPIMMIGVSMLTEEGPDWIKKLRSIILLLLFKNFKAFLTIGKLNTKYYKKFNVPDSKLFFIPYYADPEFFTKKHKELYNKKTQLKKELGLDPNSLTILQVARLIPLKRPMDLLRGFHSALERQKEIKTQLVFVGKGPEKKILNTYIKKHKIKNVFFAGFKDRQELPKYYAMADIFVLPSASETWGSVINEAMEFGLPIITTDNVAAGHNLVIQGKNGFVYPVGDIKNLEKYLEMLLTNKKLIQNMGNNSTKIISKYYKTGVQGMVEAVKYAIGKKNTR